MIIEVHILGQFYHRWPVADMQGFTIEGATWQDNCEAKAQLVEMYYQHFLKHTYPLMKHLKNRELYIVFESKMNFWENEEPELVEEYFLE